MRRWALPGVCWRCSRLLRGRGAGRPSAATALLTASKGWMASYSTGSIDVEALKRRPAKFIPDYLTPMPSHLLTKTLTDLLHNPTSTTTPRPSSATITQPASALPQGHHLVYFPLQLAPSALAADGADPDHSPDASFAKRLWAGGEVVFHGEVNLDGGAWGCREEIGDVRVRGGEGREKVFVDVWRRYGLGHGQGGGNGTEREWDIEELRTLVFMRNEGDASGAASSSSVAPRMVKHPHQPSHKAAFLPTPTHLFYFSALTFNAHAIHINPQHACSTDGHRSLLVHGPLTLALMLRVLTDHVGGQHSQGSVQVKKITYRNYAPLYVDEGAAVCLRRVVGKGGDGEMRQGGLQTWDVWVEGPGGGLAVRGTAVVDTGKT